MYERYRKRKIMFWKKFKFLCDKVGKSPNAVAKEIQLSSGIVSEWKKGREPLAPTKKKVADYFHVPVEYFSDNEDDTPIPTDTTGFTVDQSNVKMIPVYETVSAGLGATAEDCPTEYIPMCFDNAYEAENTICIRVKGDSMSPVVNNDDLVHVLIQDVADRGAMAVVMVDDEGFVKYMDYGTGWIELVSQNPMYRTMRFEGTDIERVRVVGIVTGITRRGVPHMNK